MPTQSNQCTLDVKNITSHDQCDQIWGDFLKFLAEKFVTKVAQIIINFLGYFKKPHSYVNTAVATSWETFRNIWATFYSNIWSHWS